MFKRFVLIAVILAVAGCSTDSEKETDTSQKDVVQNMDNGGTDSGNSGSDLASDQGQGSKMLLPQKPETKFKFKLDNAGDSVPLKLAGVDTLEDGKQYVRVELGNLDANPPIGLVAWLDWTTAPGKELGFKRFDVYQGSGAESGKPDFTYLLKTPGIIYIDGSHTEKRDIEPVESSLLMKSGEDMGITYSGTQQIISINDTITVPYGTIDGCWHFHIDLIEAFDDEKEGEAEPIGIDFWAKSGMGIVKASMIPGFGAMELVEIQ